MITRSERSVVLLVVSVLMVAGALLQPVAIARLYKPPALPYLHYWFGVPLALMAAWLSVRLCRSTGHAISTTLRWSATAVVAVSLVMVWLLKPQIGMGAATLAVLPVMGWGALLARHRPEVNGDPADIRLASWIWPCWAISYCVLSDGQGLPFALIASFAVCFGARRHQSLWPICSSIGYGMGALVGWYAFILFISAYRRQKLATLLLIDDSPLDRFGIHFQHFQVQSMLAGEGAFVRLPGANDRFLLAALIGHSGYLAGAAVAIVAVGVILSVVKRLLRKPVSVECAFGLPVALLLLLHAFTNVLANTGVIAYPVLALPFFTPSIPLFIAAGCFAGVVWSAVPLHVSSVPQPA